MRAASQVLIEGGIDPASAFPWGRIDLQGEFETLMGDAPAVVIEDSYRRTLRDMRQRDRAAGRTLRARRRRNCWSSTVRRDSRCTGLDRRAEGPGDRPGDRACEAGATDVRHGSVMLLDEVAAHLDPARREALYRELDALGAQVWMTGTDAQFFTGLPARSVVLTVEEGRVLPRHCRTWVDGYRRTCPFCLRLLRRGRIPRPRSGGRCRAGARTGHGCGTGFHRGFRHRRPDLVHRRLDWPCGDRARIRHAVHVIKYAGCAYLLWLAWRIWSQPVATTTVEADGRHHRAWPSFPRSLSLTLGNPKVMVFFLSIMPLVVDVGDMSAFTFVEMAAVIVLVITPVMTTALVLRNARAGCSPRGGPCARSTVRRHS